MNFYQYLFYIYLYFYFYYINYLYINTEQAVFLALENGLKKVCKPFNSTKLFKIKKIFL